MLIALYLSPESLFPSGISSLWDILSLYYGSSMAALASDATTLWLVPYDHSFLAISQTEPLAFDDCFVPCYS